MTYKEFSKGNDIVYEPQGEISDTLTVTGLSRRGSWGVTLDGETIALKTDVILHLIRLDWI